MKLQVEGVPHNLSVCTFGEYIANLPKATVIIADPYDDFEFRWLWGVLAGRLHLLTREAQRKVEQAERLAIFCKKDLSAKIADAWRILLMAEHHDTQSCFPVKFGIW